MNNVPLLWYRPKQVPLFKHGFCFEQGFSRTGQEIPFCIFFGLAHYIDKIRLCIVLDTRTDHRHTSRCSGRLMNSCRWRVDWVKSHTVRRCTSSDKYRCRKHWSYCREQNINLHDGRQVDSMDCLGRSEHREKRSSQSHTPTDQIHRMCQCTALDKHRSHHYTDSYRTFVQCTNIGVIKHDHYPFIHNPPHGLSKEVSHRAPV